MLSANEIFDFAIVPIPFSILQLAESQVNWSKVDPMPTHLFSSSTLPISSWAEANLLFHLAQTLTAAVAGYRKQRMEVWLRDYSVSVDDRAC